MGGAPRTARRRKTGAMTSRLGELLVRRGLISGAQLERALEEQRHGSATLAVTLVHLGLIGEATLAGCLQREYHLALVDPGAATIPADVLRLVPDTLAHRHHLVPTTLVGSSLTVAMSDPSNLT